MRVLPRLLAAVLGPVVAFAATTEPTPPATLAAYLERAQEANPDLKAFQDRYEAAKARIPQAAALPDPTLQITHFVESVQTRTGPQENILVLSQRVPWFGRLDARETAASAEAEAILRAAEARQLMLARMVGTAFYDYAYLGKAIDLTGQNLALLEQLAPRLEENTRTGGDLNRLLRLKVEIGRLRDRLATLGQQRAQQNARLAALLDLPADATLPWPEWPVDAPAETPAIDTAGLLGAVDTANPELLMLEAKRDSASARIELARLETRPDLTLGITYIQIGSPTVNPTTPDAGRDPWGVTLAVNLPIWNRRTTGARDEASANRRAADRELSDRRNQLHADALVALSTLSDANRRARLYETELLPLARQAVDNTTAAYQSDRASLLDLIDSQRSQLDLQLQLWQARADAAKQRIILQTLANRPL